MKPVWIDRAGKYPVVRLDAPMYREPVRFDVPPTGILHTTEGGWRGFSRDFGHRLLATLHARMERAGPEGRDWPVFTRGRQGICNPWRNTRR